MDAPATRWQRRKSARPHEIINAALHLFIAKGFAATRLDDVAREAGVTKSTVYLYFENKEDLFKAVVRETLVANLAFAESLVAEHQGSAASLLQCLLDAWAERMETLPATGIARLMIAESANFPELARFYMDEVVVRTRLLYQGVLQRGVASGEFRELDLMEATRVTIAPLLLMKLWSQSFADCDPEPADLRALARFHFDMLIRGLRADTTC
ncbi:TetR/AcrR family transcriptional regulator [Chitinimonas sp. BJYL2]|uniref:TetR/AcrR family transcriptional regulator n=1 Tax=Chitinimonas sp. BJYL2 TaxID=2976696 RepID=UPI0022B4AE61|nr:TetR/AcrR family transcriptional regulator [Chitinimonas sp. BJYL2]